MPDPVICHFQKTGITTYGFVILFTSTLLNLQRTMGILRTTMVILRESMVILRESMVILREFMEKVNQIERL